MTCVDSAQPYKNYTYSAFSNHGNKLFSFAFFKKVPKWVLAVLACLPTQPVFRNPAAIPLMEI